MFTSILPILLLVQYSPINIRRKGVFAHEKKCKKIKFRAFRTREIHTETLFRDGKSRLRRVSKSRLAGHRRPTPWNSHGTVERVDMNYSCEKPPNTYTHRTCACIINTYRVRCSGGSGKMWQEAIMGSIEFLWFHIVGCFVFLCWAISAVFVENVALSIVCFVLFLEFFL